MSTDRFARATSAGYRHPEAFCLMLYQGTESKRVIDIWNARDGVTPFIAFIDGEEYAHTAFAFDRCVPRHKLRPGDYYWRNMTREEAARAAAIRCDAAWADGYPQIKPREQAIQEVADSIWQDGNAPCLDRAPFISIVDDE